MTKVRDLCVDFIVAAMVQPDSDEGMIALQNFSSIPVPSDLSELLSEVSELELFIRNDENYLRIWGASSCIEMNEIYYVQHYIPNSLAFGDDGGGGTFMYVDGHKGFGVYYARFADLDVDELVKISGSLHDLLNKGVGVDKLLSVYEE